MVVHLAAVLQHGIYGQFAQNQSQHTEWRYPDVPKAVCLGLRHKKLDLQVPGGGRRVPSAQGLVERLRGERRVGDA